MDIAVAQAIQDVIPRVLDLQERIHRDPELSNQEKRTRDKVCNFLKDLGLNIRSNPDSFGFIADLEIDPEWETLAFRADMDALPIHEKTSCGYVSENPGVMHACGHDFHTAILAGTAMVLAQKREVLAALKRNIRFIFQHAEENNPVGGARDMIRSGATENCRAVFGLHVWPELETGTIAVRPGPLMAASDRVTITIRGKSSHAARPEAGVDTIAVAGEIISALQAIVSRKIRPVDPAVITLGTIEGGDRYNIIAEKTTINGTVRTLSESARETIENFIKKVTRGIAESFDATVEVAYTRGFPVLNNDGSFASWAAEALKRQRGQINVVEDVQPALTAEDFAFYVHEVPAVFMWLGCSSPNLSIEERLPLHNSAFCADQKCLEVGIRVFTGLALAAK